MAIGLKPILFSTLCAVAQADGVGQGISKSTYSASDPVTFFSFLSKYLPVRCQDTTYCNTTFSSGCGSVGRAALCLDEECAIPDWGPGFGALGLHMVNMSSRPYGELDNIDVEKHFSERLGAAFAKQKYDHFMDFTTVLYAPVLDTYVSAFKKDRVPFMVLRWRDDKNQVWYSVIVQVDTSQVVLELVSSKKPNGVSKIVDDSLSRLPASVFSDNSVSSVSSSIMIVLAVSKGTSDMSGIDSFYKDDLSATESLNVKDGKTHLKTFTLKEANAVVRFVYRPPTGGFGVADLEKAKHAAHNMAHTDEFCGVDKWYDNHFAYDFSNTSLDTYKDNFDKSGRTYHIFGDCSSGMASTNLYVVDPTGDAVQMDGQWDNCPTGGSGDALMNACSQGKCSKYTASTKCAKELKKLCSSVKGEDASCTDCSYNNWGALSKAGCRNADVVNYCYSSTSTTFESSVVV